MVASDNAVTNSGLADNWHTRFRQGGNVSVNSSNTGGKFFGDLFGPRHPAPLQVNQYCHQSIDPVHWTILGSSSPESTNPFLAIPRLHFSPASEKCRLGRLCRTPQLGSAFLTYSSG
jgi:hypothetical protein